MTAPVKKTLAMIESNPCSRKRLYKSGALKKAIPIAVANKPLGKCLKARMKRLWRLPGFVEYGVIWRTLQRMGLGVRV